MQAANRNKHQYLGINAAHLGVSAGPLSLLLLPKCPLCLVPLLAVLGLAMPPTIGLRIASGLLVAGWLAILLAATRRQPVIRAVMACRSAPPAIANAVVDALWHLGVRHIDIPITPWKVQKILKENGVAE